MHMTISYLGIPNDQLPAKRSRNTFAIYNRSSITASYIQRNQFVSETTDANGGCFIWSTNPLAFNVWLPINCNTKVTYPFILCEKNLKSNQTRLFYTRPNVQCTLEFLDFKGYCIRLTQNVNNKRMTHLNWDAKAMLVNAVLMRILTAWTIPPFTGQKRHAINVVIWSKNNNCECFTSVDTLYMERKTWYHENCNCSMKYPTLIMVPQTNTFIPNNIFSCDNGSFKQVAYRCDGEIDCSEKEDKQNCSHI